jgi:hypothetical protein
MSEITVAPTADEHLALALAPEPVTHPFWPKAVITFGLVLTAAWMCFLGYGLVKLVELAI